MNDFQLAKAEDAITKLAHAINFSEADIVEALEDGLNLKWSGNIPRNYKEFLDEMKATFDCY
jgi:hypothetical protein